MSLMVSLHLAIYARGLGKSALPAPLNLLPDTSAFDLGRSWGMPVESCRFALNSNRRLDKLIPEA